MPETIQAGRDPESIVEGGAGGDYCRALILTELDNAAYAVEEEFSYDTNEPATDLVRLIKDLRAHLERLSVADDATLTVHRVCSACGGDGKDWHLQEPERSMNPCEDCDGRGYDEKG
jgi:hypothetical protein